MFNGEEFGKQIVAATKSHIDKTVAPLLAEIASLKAEMAILKAIPAPKDGKDGAPGERGLDGAAGKDGAPGAKGEPGDVGAPGADGTNGVGINGKDGVGLAGAMIDRKGVLILTLSDGTTRELGHVVGKDVDMVTVEGMVDKATHKAISEAWAAIPEPKDGERGPQGEPGKSITVEDIAPLIETAVAKHVEAIERVVPDVVKSAVSLIKVPEAPQLPDIPAMVEAAVKALPPAQDGKDADPALVASLVAETVERAVAALPVPKDGQDGSAGADGRDGVNGADGKSVSIDDIRPLIEETVTKAVTLIPVPRDGVDGKDGTTIEELLPVIGQEVSKAVSAIPAPKDGTNGKDGATVEELLPHINDTIAKAVSAIPVPKDGKNGLDAVKFLRGEKGNLIVTMSNGTVEDLGEIDGKDADMEAVERSIAEKVAAIPIPKDGVDGIGFDDINDIEEDDGRFIVRQVFHAGRMVKETRIQTKMPLYRGIHDQVRIYLPGDQVSRGGSIWHCHTECKGAFNGDYWVLAVKKGRDGKPD